jgi:hypothetical protein
VIARGGKNANRAATLYVKDGRFRFETEEGDKMTDAEAKAAGQRLDQFQTKPWPKD